MSLTVGAMACSLWRWRVALTKALLDPVLRMLAAHKRAASRYLLPSSTATSEARSIHVLKLAPDLAWISIWWLDSACNDHHWSSQ